MRLRLVLVVLGAAPAACLRLAAGLPSTRATLVRRTLPAVLAADDQDGDELAKEASDAMEGTFPPLTPPPLLSEEVDVMSMSDLRRRNLLQYVDTGSKRTYDDDDDRKEGGSPEWSARDRSRSGVFSMLGEERQRVLGPDRDEY